MAIAHQSSAIVVSVVLLLVSLSGCLGASDGSGSAPDDSLDETSRMDRNETDNSDPVEPSDGNASQPTDENATERRTSRNSTMVLVNAAGPTGTLVGSGDIGLLAEPPSNYTGILLEFTWTTPTQQTGFGSIAVDVDDDGDFLNTTRASDDGPARMRVRAGQYTSGDLHAWAHPHETAPPNAWIAANVTAFVTIFSDGPPDWSYSAVT